MNVTLRKENVRLAVVGAGPSGLYAATTAARRGMRVTLFEKRGIGEHITCGECIFDSLDALTPPTAGLLYEVAAILFVARGAYRLRMGKYRRLWMVDRQSWQRQLAAAAADLGVDVRTGVKISPSGIKELCNYFEWIIDASGAPSLTSRAEGFTEEYFQQPLLAYQLELEDDFSSLFASRTIKVGFLSLIGKEYLPGYYWIFPKNNRTANVGVVYTRGDKGGHFLKLKELLRFVRERESLQTAKVIRKGGGLIPTRILPRLVHDRIILTGDAAGLTSPLHGGGIDLACLSGTMAVDAIAKGTAGVAAYRRNLLSLMKSRLYLERRLIAKMQSLSFAGFDDLIHAAAVNRPGIRTRVALRHPDLLAAAWRWLKRQRPL